MTSREDFDEIDNWIEDIERYSSSNIILWICGTKIDRSGERAVSTEEGCSIASKYDANFFCDFG